MTGIGMLLLAIAFIAVIYWLIEARKAGKIQSVPFRTAAEIAAQGPAAADAKGLVSLEGNAEAQPILAPMSGQPCLYWEIEISRVWEKHSVNSQGQSTKSSGKTSVTSDKGGTVFALNDGGARVMVDLSKKPDADLKESHSSAVNIGMILPGQLQFGNLHAQVPEIPRGENVKAFEGREKIIPYVPGQRLFALGKLTQGAQGPTIAEDGSLFGSLMISNKSRAETLGKSVKNAKISKIAGLSMAGVGAVLCTLGFFFDKPAQAEQPAETAQVAATAAEAPASNPTDSSDKPALPQGATRPASASNAGNKATGAVTPTPAATTVATATTSAATAQATSAPVVASATPKVSVPVKPAAKAAGPKHK
jgi:hypothetical protein